MCSAPASRSFDEALADALGVGQQELASLDCVRERVTGAYVRAGNVVASDGASDGFIAEFDAMRLRFNERLENHFAEQSKVLSKFNIVFFGRTGAGKSTLMSAFGELDGEAVSPYGESDWTKVVATTEWRGCRLYDTPGISGWGRRTTREELEATARNAVKIADVVLLCFDTQSQQDSEFGKVADWVTHFGKPVIAVLNVRNPRWRHPARVSSQTVRRNMSKSVAEHAENVRDELANIGLDDVPVVAISSRRALFARASVPYQGPTAQNFDRDRDTYGIDYLARWSNFEALEGVLSACIRAGGAQLRLKSLREGVRAILQDEFDSLQRFRRSIVDRINQVDRLIRRYLEVLGYLEANGRATYLREDATDSDLLTMAERARGGRYPAPIDGALARQVRNILKPHLSEPRNNAIQNFKDLRSKAFDGRKVVDGETFSREVFNEKEIASALARVGAEAKAFLERELALAGFEVRPRSVEFGKVRLDGNAGDTAGTFADALRLGGLAVGAGAMFAAGPIGWLAAAGIGLAGTGIAAIGDKTKDSADRGRDAARANADRLGSEAIHDTFDAIERGFSTDASSAAWLAAAPTVRPLLGELITLIALRDDIDAVRTELGNQASRITETPPFHLLDVTAHLRHENTPLDRGNRAARTFLLGEDWFDHNGSIENAAGADEFTDICRQRHQADLAALSRALHDAFALPDAADLQAWHEQVRQAAESDEAFQSVETAAQEHSHPVVVVAGDYSAGKSSFIKRMITEFGGDVPESLHVRADATTDQITRYPMGSVEIVDTPGFQSRHAGHDELALAGARDAALVIVLLHVNLLIGDTTALQKIAHGSSTTSGKWPRMLFLVNRCDELGVDPHDSTEEFFSRRLRKQKELAASLKSRDIHVGPEHIHGVAADPFGGVGAQLPVTAGDYDANRSWDGIPALADALRAWVDHDLTHAAALVAFDHAFTEVLSLSDRTRTGMTTYRDEAGKHGSLIEAMTICLADANYLTQSLEHELDAVLNRQVSKAIADVRRVTVGDEQALGAAIYSWRSPETVSAIKRLMETATEKVNDWSATHLSQIKREEDSAGFDVTLDLPGPASSAGNSDAFGQAVGAAGNAARIGGQIGKAAGSREAALQIGHFFGHKFKPWGAIKAGKAIGRVGAVLGVVAVAADAASWANKASKKKSWEARRDAAVEQMESDSRKLLRQLMSDPEGPWKYLAERAEQVGEIRGQYVKRQRSACEEADRLENRLAVADELATAAQTIRKATNHE